MLFTLDLDYSWVFNVGVPRALPCGRDDGRGVNLPEADQRGVVGSAGCVMAGEIPASKTDDGSPIKSPTDGQVERRGTGEVDIARPSAALDWRD